MSEMAETKIERSEELVKIAKGVLAGEDPDVQAATLAQLLAMFMAGHHPDMRDAQRELLLQAARMLEDVEVEILIAEGRVPPEWRSKAESAPECNCGGSESIDDLPGCAVEGTL